MSGPRRLWCAPLPDAGEAALPTATARHAHVLRLSPGDAVVLFDGAGREADAVLLEEGRCRVEATRTVQGPRPRVVLCQALPKGTKLDAIVRAVTELGVSAVHLVDAERSVAKLDEARAAKRLDRLARVAREAARQAGRADVPELVPPAPLAEVLARVPEGAARVVTVVGAEPGGALSGDEVWVLVGPEGGLSEAEVEAAREAGFSSRGLGPFTLRVETAAPVACALAREALSGAKTGEKPASAAR